MYVVFGFSTGESASTGFLMGVSGRVPALGLGDDGAVVPGGPGASASAEAETRTAPVAAARKPKIFIALASCASVPGKNLCQASANTTGGKASPLNRRF